MPRLCVLEVCEPSNFPSCAHNNKHPVERSIKKTRIHEALFRLHMQQLCGYASPSTSILLHLCDCKFTLIVLLNLTKRCRALCRFIPAAIELHQENDTEPDLRYLKLRAGPRMYISSEQQSLRAWYRTEGDCLTCHTVTPVVPAQHVSTAQR